MEWTTLYRAKLRTAAATADLGGRTRSTHELGAGSSRPAEFSALGSWPAL